MLTMDLEQRNMLEVQHTEWLPTFGQLNGYIPIILTINVPIANEPGVWMRPNNNDNIPTTSCFHKWIQSKWEGMYCL